MKKSCTIIITLLYESLNDCDYGRIILVKIIHHKKETFKIHTHSIYYLPHHLANE